MAHTHGKIMESGQNAPPPPSSHGKRETSPGLAGVGGALLGLGLGGGWVGLLVGGILGSALGNLTSGEKNDEDVG